MLYQAMTNVFGDNWTRGELETLTITFIGILAPTGFTIFMHYLLRRSSSVAQRRNAETAEFIKEVRRKYAEDEIGRRRRAATEGL